MPICIIAGNWKMNTTLDEAKILVSAMAGRLDSLDSVERVVCPPYVSIAAVAELLQETDVALGAQDMHYEGGGAFTGEISPKMLQGLCQYVILGHSERRQLFAETDEMINRKVHAALEHGLRPIVCVGESLEQRDAGDANAVVESQVRAALAGVESAAELVLAYEPVWAIGTGRAATSAIAQEMLAHIRSVLASLYGQDPANNVPLLYGGSVNASNVADYLAEPDLNGALVGGASLDADSFVDIVQRAAATVV
ncbi:MAG: triose-phosphate isomerase [SAR202 cluster bacterium Casp-Chloro-G4]|nr:triose-phosphate isomerase [Chloroflexota bacterium]PKB61976.1 MAG: triose-phosphate isomerase [SAR202 cluster bacterium Casp-Chloro-G4]